MPPRPAISAHFSNGHTPSGGRSCEEETRLIQRMAARDQAAVGELYALYSAPIFSYALRSLGNAEEAEEVLQDAIVRLWERAAEFDPALSKPFTWTFMFVRGLCLDRLRKSGRRSRAIPLVPLDEQSAALDGESGAGVLAAREEWRRVAAAMVHLPAQERQAVEMVVFLECTGPEIADRLNEPLGTIKSRVRRGLMRLRQLLKSHD